ncbi:MAG: FecR family protein [Leptospirales bacterium]|nr:FecR family protein [Leptospirales bacterium]
MKSLNKVSLLIVICLAVILVSSYFLYRELTGKIHRGDEDAIGTLFIKKNVVERKYAEYVIWEGISKSSPFFNYDTIRTVTDSAACLQFNDGGEISIDEETMIIIVYDKKGIKVNFDQGSISVKGDSSNNITINTKNVSISADKGDFTVKKKGDRVGIDVSSGEAVINKKGEITKINSSVSANITDEKIEVQELPIIPESPSNNKYFVICKNIDAINFKWSSNLSGAETIQVALDPDFKNIKHTGTTKLKTYSIDIAPGDYYWRVVASKEMSQTRKFTVLSDKQPEIIFPKKNDVIEIAENEMVNFKWTKSDFVLGYDFYFSQDRAPQNSDSNTRCDINSANIPNLKSGNVMWNVIYNYPESFTILFDPKISGAFNLKAVSTVHVKPKLLNDDNMKVSKFSDKMNFNWEGNKGIKSYKVDISSDKDFKNILQTSTTRLTAYNADILPEGRYFFKVSAIYDDNTIVASDITTFDVITPQPVIYLYPENGSTVTDLYDSLKFTWRDNANAWNYFFELSSDQDFKNTIHSIKTEKMNAQIKIPPKGKYYWRAAIVDKSGEPVLSGKTAYFTIVDSIKKMTLIYPKNTDIINLDNIDSINCRWNGVEGANSYEIEFFQSIRGKNKPVFVLNSKRTDVSLSNFSIFNQGEVKWLVRAKRIDKGRLITVSESEMSSFIIRANENISAPKIEAPEVIYVK